MMKSYSMNFEYQEPYAPILQYFAENRIPAKVVTGEIRFIQRDGTIAWRQGEYVEVSTIEIAQSLHIDASMVFRKMCERYPDFNYFESWERIEEQKAGVFLCISFEQKLPALPCNQCVLCSAEESAYVCSIDLRTVTDVYDLGKYPAWCAINEAYID